MRITFLMLMILILCLPASAQAFQGPVEPGGQFPTFKGMTVDGFEFDLENFLHSDLYIFVDFWASWCGPCKEEMPYVVEAWQRYGIDELMVVGINMDEPENLMDVTEYMVDENVTFPVINDYVGMMAPLSQELMVDEIPTSYLLDPEGNVIFRNLRHGELAVAMEMLKDKKNYPGGVETSVTVLDDPRLQEGYTTPDDVYEGQLVSSNPEWLFDRPDELVFMLHAEGNNMPNYYGALLVTVLYPTGRSTHMIKDQNTGDVYRGKYGLPYVFWEVEPRFYQYDIQAVNGVIDGDYTLQLNDDAFEVRWQFAVWSDVYGDFVMGEQEMINFPCLFYITKEEINAQNGIYWAR